MIKVKVQPGPTIPDSVLRDLRVHYPNIWLRWDGRAIRMSDDTYEGRWKIYYKLEENSHPHFRATRSRHDVWHNGAWHRLIQTWSERNYRGDDVGFAPIDSRLINVLHQADTFRSRRWYEDNIEHPEARRIQGAEADMMQTGRDVADYYHNMDNPAVGRYTKGSWRHRIR